MNLADLLGSCSPERFLNEFWERQPLLVERGAGLAGGEPLLTTDDVDRILTTFELRYPAFRLVKLGKDIPLSKYARDSRLRDGPSVSGLADVEAIISEFQGGATLILQGLHRSWEPLAVLCRSVETFFNYPTQTNIYLTPPSAQGFAKHWDTHDVFVIQLSGHKHWSVYDSPAPLPLTDQPYRPGVGAPPNVILTHDLCPGDVLYIPRGFIHEAFTSDTPSLHITLGVLSYTWRDLLHHLIDVRAENDIELRRGVPGGRQRDETMQGITDTLTRILASLRAPELGLALHRLDDRFLSTRRPLLRGHLFEHLGLAEIHLDSQVSRRPHILFRLDRKSATQTHLLFHRKRITFPARVAPALLHAVSTPSFTPRGLPDCTDASGKLVLVRRLVKEGFLTTES